MFSFYIPWKHQKTKYFQKGLDNIEAKPCSALQFYV